MRVCNLLVLLKGNEVKITRQQIRRLIKEATEKTYLGVPEEHILNALWQTWEIVRADVPEIAGAPWNVIGEEVFAMLPTYEAETADLFYKLSPDEQDELLKKAFN